MAPTYLSPGVYVEEVSGGSKPIAGVGTAVAAFVGFAQKGPANTHTLVTNWTQFVETFGDFMEGSYLAHAVYGYYNNGGGRCYIVRIGASDDGGAEVEGAAPAAVALLPANTATAVQARDPRSSIATLYKSFHDYLGKYEAATDSLIEQGYLLPGFKDVLMNIARGNGAVFE